MSVWRSWGSHTQTLSDGANCTSSKANFQHSSILWEGPPKQTPTPKPAHPSPPRLELQGTAGLQKKMSQKKELELQKATNVK